MSEVTQVLGRIELGEGKAAEELLPLVYEELRKLAAQRLSCEKPGQTLTATALVHEAYVRLVDVEQAQRWDSRGHFFVAAAEAMRRILVENARRKRRIKHGGGLGRVGLEAAELPGRSGTSLSPEDLLALDEAIEDLQREDPVKARLVKLRYFAGMTIDQASETLKISRVTAHRYWTYARAWLYRKLAGDRP